MKNVRIVFSKTGRAKYVSHLDLVRTMSRAVRRAGIPLWYTEGFNRHPYLTFAAPLSLGYEGLRETMDLRLEEDMPYDRLVERLNEVLPEGLTAVSAAEAVCKAGQLFAAEYRITLYCSAEAVRAALALPELPVEKKTKKKTTKTVDLKPYFANATVKETGETAVMTVTLPSGGADNINPGLFVTALSGILGSEIRVDVLRLRLLQADGTEFL
ncbi:MAG: DUF2344 domain-containing protein [Clostridia bacterium]|nr:DUF2344 domain-containing protein [Clostridia bacterium]